MKCTHILSISNNHKTECSTSGTFLQTIGKSKCYSGGNTSGDYTFQAFSCASPGVFGTHVWTKAERRYCNDTLLHDLYTTNTIFALKDTDGKTQYTINGDEHKIRGYQLKNGCISVYCKSGYVAPVSNNAGCVSITTQQNNMCKATSADVSSSLGGTFKLSIDGKTNTTNSTRMICRTQADIAESYKSAELKDVCAEDIHAFLPKPAGNTADDAKYFTCTDTGWKQQQLNKCARHDNITSLTSCNNIDNCIIKIYKGTNSAEEVTFPTHEDEYSGGLTKTISDYCYRFVCADGYTWYNKKCTDNATIQAELDEQQRKKQACIDSFGTWDEDNNQCTCAAEKNLEYATPQQETCKCKDNYEPDAANKICVPTDTEAK
ncbi:MAG: hypothetical protein IKV10_02760, partial [Alphaproteobacteria bacterium]|nr:hypothetical protein [Alphaproteobacteria bacterium]